MSIEQFSSLMIALAAVFAAVAKCIAELRAYHAAVNSKMDQLLELTASSSRAAGRLEQSRATAKRVPSERAGKLPLHPDSEAW